MKALMKSVLFALAAAGVSVAMTASTSAQVFKPRDQTCDNKSTARDKTLRPDTRCLQGGPGKEKAADERANQRLNSFIKANPPEKTYDVFGKGGTVSQVRVGVDGRGIPYRIINGEKGISGSGSASGLSRNYSGGNGSSKGHTSR